jgi:hypothetical protein
VGSRAALDAVAKRKSLCHCQGLNPGRPARSLVTILAELQPLNIHCSYLKKLFLMEL